MNMHHWGGMGPGTGDWWMTPIPLLALPLIGLVLIFALWSLVWKGLGLWHAARRGEYWWFVAMLFINTAGILEIVYLFFFAKLKARELFSRHDHRV